MLNGTFDPKQVELAKYLFFTGKGGVGKTSVACATAVTLADSGKKVLLISTDPASNLQDVFQTELNIEGVPIKGVPNLVVANLDPEEAAMEYRESVVAPYRGKLPDALVKNMEEQLSGSCTVEIAAFNEFSGFITDENTGQNYDHIIFDTAPTGHTLRLMQLPSAWSNFISENTRGASCLGQLAGLESKREMYKQAVKTLSDKDKTTLILVTRPENTSLKEAERASIELRELGVNNQILLINGILQAYDDTVSRSLFEKQQGSIESMPPHLKRLDMYEIPLRSYNIIGIENVRAFLYEDKASISDEELNSRQIPKLRDVIDDLCSSGKEVIFTMGKGGVGKTTIAAAVALGMVRRGSKVHLTTTDPAAHIKFVIEESENLTTSRIDEEAELARYKEEVLSKARETMSEDDIAYIEEDLRSPCTQEIAVFRAFAQIVERSKEEIVVIDTAPTGHTLLLLDSTLSYHREIERSQGDVPEAVQNLLPKLRDPDRTEVLIVTLAETTPVHEAMRLESDLERAGISSKWWIINSSLYATQTTNKTLRAKASNEIEWINKVDEHSNGNFAVIEWKTDEIKGEKLLDLIE
jgi:arsenite-transporting ATPase